MATSIRDIHDRFNSDACDVTDTEALLLMQKLRVSQNAEAAIYNYMAVLAHLCCYKPQLFAKLFAYLADAFVCMNVGSYNEAQAYADYLLNQANSPKWETLSPEAGLWLHEQWPTYKPIVDKVLAEELEKALNY